MTKVGQFVHVCALNRILAKPSAIVRLMDVFLFFRKDPSSMCNKEICNIIECCVLGTLFAHNICILTEVKHLKNSMMGCTPEICEFTTEYSTNNHIHTHTKRIENIDKSY